MDNASSGVKVKASGWLLVEKATRNSNKTQLLGFLDPNPGYL